MKTLLVFTQDEANCIWCERYNPVLEELENAGVQIEKVYAFDTEGNHNPLNAIWDIKATPTTIVLKDGAEVNRFVSAKPKTFVLEKLKD